MRVTGLIPFNSQYLRIFEASSGRAAAPVSQAIGMSEEPRDVVSPGIRTSEHPIAKYPRLRGGGYAQSTAEVVEASVKMVRPMTVRSAIAQTGRRLTAGDFSQFVEIVSQGFFWR